MAYTNYWEHTFHDASSTTGNGTALQVKGRTTLTVEVYSAGGNSARTVTFYGKSKSGTLRLIPGVKLSGDTNFTMATSTTGTGEIWQFDTTGLDYVVMDLTAITSGTVTVKGEIQ